MRHVGPIIAAAAIALAAPQAARAATLDPLAGCYRSVDVQTRENVVVRAQGFTPGAVVIVSIDGAVVRDDVTALHDGTVEGSVPAPHQAKGEKPFTLTVTERDRPSNTASAKSRVTALALRLKPRQASPSRRVRFVGRGFTDGTRAYGHYVKAGRHRRTVDLGEPRGACGRIDVKRRQIPIRRPRTGRWTLQVDNQLGYSAEPASVFVRLAITVQRVLRRP
jgi:hypothetical protein